MKKLLQYATRPRYTLDRVLENLREPREVSWTDMPKDSQAIELAQNRHEVPRIAVVKQDVYQDLYCCPHGTSLNDMISSSLKRSGPVALFSRLNADFWIVRTEPDAECNVWKEKCYDCRQAPLEHYESLKILPFNGGQEGHTQAQGEFAVSVDSINWSNYDFVISYDISVPKRITLAHQQIVWAYCLGEPCMGSYSRSHERPITGYDLFLNQRFRRLPPGYKLPDHEIEFPYYFQYYGCFDSVYGLLETVRSGLMVEVHTNEELTGDQRHQLSEFGPTRAVRRPTSATIQALRESKYFIRMGGRNVWGNAMVEAIAAGCLAIGNPDEYKNKGLFTPDTSVSGFDELIGRIKYFENNDAAYKNALDQQRYQADYLCYLRPLSDLIRAGKRVLSTRPVNKARS